MHKVVLFVEDTGHRLFIEALMNRMIRLYNVEIEYKFEAAVGGHGAVITGLKQYIRDMRRDKKGVPNLLIVAIDGNCKGFSGKKQEIDNAVKGFNNELICAIPDPHIERWLLLDSAAFKKVLGKGCSAPMQKCERDLYKRLLLEAVRNAGIDPYLGGVEYTEAIVNAMNLDYLERIGDSLSRFLKELRQKFQEWEREQQRGGQQVREQEAAYDAPSVVAELPTDIPPT